MGPTDIQYVWTLWRHKHIIFERSHGVARASLNAPLAPRILSAIEAGGDVATGLLVADLVVNLFLLVLLLIVVVVVFHEGELPRLLGFACGVVVWTSQGAHFETIKIIMTILIL